MIDAKELNKLNFYNYFFIQIFKNKYNKDIIKNLKILFKTFETPKKL